MSEKVKSEASMSQPKPADRRKARLAAALRENLRKRKDQARERDAGEQIAIVPPETSTKR
ncbi:MAG: hypothetical protein ACRDBL_01710 [Rhabdaerophilum sp.]